MKRIRLVSAMLLLAACRSERPPPPDFTIPAQPSPAASAPAQEGAPATRPVTERTRNPELQQFLPPHPEDLGRGPAPVPRPAAAQPFYVAPPNLGPVTGYGPGGMAQPPGAPPNPPYPPGGLSAPR